MNKNNIGSSVDWRQALRQNARRTKIVIALFVLIYTLVGLLVDMMLHYSLFIQAYQQYYPGQSLQISAPSLLGQLFVSLVTFNIIPWATIIMLVVAAVSLLVTYNMYNRIMLLGTKHTEVTAQSSKPEEKQLYNIVEEMKVAAGINYMPKLYIIEADYMNAFASGYSEKSAMIAVTRGLMAKLNRQQLQAVMAHELSHIRHGDIKLTLTASVLSNLTLLVLDVLFYGVLFGGGRRRQDRGGGANWLVIIVIIARFVLPLINVLLMLYLSRTREYMADAGCVQLQRDNQPLIEALLLINQDHKANAKQYGQAYDQTAHENVRRESYIYDPVKMGIEASRGPVDLFSTHPDMQKRLAALGYHQPADKAQQTNS